MIDLSAFDWSGDDAEEPAVGIAPTAGAPQARPRFAGLPDLPALVTLMALAHWVAWAFRHKSGVAKPIKMPIDPATGRAASTSNSTTWGTYAAAAARAERDGLAGVGYVLTADDGLTGFDLDDCRDPVTGELSPLAAEIVALGETYAEVSPSGRGLRGFALGKVARAVKRAGVEVYGTGRYLTVTGDHVKGTPGTINPAPKTLALLGATGPQGAGKGGTQELGPLPAYLAAEAPDGIVLPEIDRPKPSPRAVAKACPTFVRMLQNLEAAREPEWFSMLQIVRHTAGGETLAHELSAKHPDYAPAVTQARLDRLAAGRMGPPTCGTLESLYGVGGPCRGCANRGQPNSSPIAFARREGKNTVTAEDGTTRQRALITVEGGGIHAAADAAVQGLRASGAPIYQRSGKLVRPVVEELDAAHGRAVKVAKLAEVKVAGLRDALARHVDFQRFDGRAKKFVMIDPPRDLAEVILSRGGTELPFPSVAGCITTPTVRADGSLLLAPGYDAATRLYHHVDPDLSIPAMPEAPTRTDAKVALRLLNGLLDSFPFVGPVDRAVALSALMMATLRGGMPVAPLHLIRAHTAGTGKSFLVDLASTIATGRVCPVSSGGSGEEEMEKRLTGLLLSGASVVSLDNLNGDLDGVFLCQAIERPLVALRRLGTSEVSEVECRAAVFATGNNTVVKGDMVRRTLTCNLDAGVEDPETRSFRFDPVARVLADRGAYIAAVLTIARAHRAYTASGGRTPCPPLGSFGGYSVAVREPLVWLGIEDPVASMEATRAADPERAIRRELFGHWEAALELGKLYQAHEVSDKALTSLAGPLSFSAFLLLHFPGPGLGVNTLKLGRYLARIIGDPIGGRKLEMQPDPKHGHAYRLVQAGSG